MVTSPTSDAELPSRSKSPSKSSLSPVANCQSPNDPEDADLAYYCKGLPSDYTDAHVPCQKCLIKEAPTRDEKDKGGNKGGNGDHGGGNTSHEAELRGEGKFFQILYVDS